MLWSFVMWFGCVRSRRRLCGVGVVEECRCGADV